MAHEVALLGRALLDALPRTGLRYAALYGSKVLEGKAAAGSQMDALIVVDEKSLPLWHKENLTRNREHYSLLPRIFGPSLPMILQDLSAGIYYNPFVKIPGQNSTEFKYGVLGYETMVKDLTQWNTFYLAGRFHKPILPIFPLAERMPEDLKIAFAKNLRMALAFSIILLPSSFTDAELFEMISGLSFMGDFRVGLAENPNKIRNIVHSGNNIQNFSQLYRDSIEYFLRSGFIRKVGDHYEVCPTTTPFSLMALLPSEFHTLDPKANIKEHIQSVLRRKNKSYSQSQSIKGVFTAGPVKSSAYALAKFRKRFEAKSATPLKEVVSVAAHDRKDS